MVAMLKNVAVTAVHETFLIKSAPTVVEIIITRNTKMYVGAAKNASIANIGSRNELAYATFMVFKVPDTSVLVKSMQLGGDSQNFLGKLVRFFVTLRCF